MSTDQLCLDRRNRGRRTIIWRNKFRGQRYNLGTYWGGASAVNSQDQAKVSILLRAWSEGDQAALDQLTPIVYDQLRRLARHYLRSERPNHSLQTTALVNEAYLRLVDCRRIQWQ